MNAQRMNWTKPRTHARRRRQTGSILILGSLVLIMLLGFMGLALDASYMYFHKRRMQTAADAGAIAGAQELLRGTTDAITVAGRKDATMNGFTHGTNSIDVTVNRPPVNGPRMGDDKFVEVIVTQAQPTWFLQALNITSATVTARAVAGLGDGNGCVYALNRDSSNANNGFFANGTTNSTFNCGVYSNSNFRAVGGGCVVTPSVSFTGEYSNPDGCGPASFGRGVPVVDPMQGRYSIPSYTGCDHNNFKVTSGSDVTLAPGVYCGGIDVGGSLANVTFSAGNYILVGGGLHITSSVNVTGSGVTFFNTYPGTQINKYDGIVINGSGTVELTAPTSGANKALLFYQDPRVSWAASNGSSMSGGSGSVFQGILYFPSTDLTYGGNSTSAGVDSSAGYTLLLGYNVKIAGSAQVNADFSSIGGSSPLQSAVFAE